MTTEAQRPGAWLHSKVGAISQDTIRLAGLNDGTSKLIDATVLGKAVIGSTGKYAVKTGTAGTTCGTITLGSGIKQGVYTLIFLSAGATGVFEVEDPDGKPMKAGAIGSAYSDQGLGFTLTAAGGNPAIGDEFTITVGVNTTYARGASDTGTGTCSAVTVFPTEVVGGTYTWTLKSGSGTTTPVFSGVDPFNKALPDLTVGTQYNGGGLQFTITDSGTHFVTGDTFTIVVDSGNDLWYALNPSATDGTQNVAGILFCTANGVDISGSGMVKAAAVTRLAEVLDALLVWPSGFTDNQIRAAKAQMVALNIIPRASV